VDEGSEVRTTPRHGWLNYEAHEIRVSGFSHKETVGFLEARQVTSVGGSHVGHLQNQARDFDVESTAEFAAGTHGLLSVLVDKPTVFQLVNKCPAFYAPQCAFMTVTDS
jgi:hypothetical protein